MFAFEIFPILKLLWPFLINFEVFCGQLCFQLNLKCCILFFQSQITLLDSPVFKAIQPDVSIFVSFCG